MKTEVKIKDMRPSLGCTLLIKDLNVYFNGSTIQDLIKAKSKVGQNHLYTIIQHGFNVGTIALSEQDFKTINELLNPIEFTRVNSDVNGNSRFVCHFLNLINEQDLALDLDFKYKLALKRAKELGGRKFHNKQYGGGIVFQMYDGQQAEMSQKIRDIANNKNK